MELFQSSPAPRCGRYNFCNHFAIPFPLFQSSPAPRCGRYSADVTLDEEHIRFNPRPHRDAGATDTLLEWARKEAVSILARTEMRALPPLVASLLDLPEFQSSPAPRCGRYLCVLRL